LFPTNVSYRMMLIGSVNGRSMAEPLKVSTDGQRGKAGSFTAATRILY
jgi:hypothetical protein